ncbi:MAG: DNA polymerase I [Bacteroidales bacterium]|nr:DNA polymerase I [Bacteroidales bacterium]MDY6427340.1 DNA polymerase I [Bacteroidales bacterium]
MKKLFLIDAYALIYRSYYAFIKMPRINSKGLNTSAIYGFVNTLEEIVKKEQPTHLAVAFDPSGPTFRHEAFEQYKAQREATPEDIRKAVPIIKDIIKAYNIPIFIKDGFEADDVIGTLSRMAEEHGFETYMVTPDKDYGQLVGGNVYMYRPRHSGGYEVMGEKEVTEKYGLANKTQVIDLLGLMGDSSDNIPGCPGIGEKTAVKLLQEFGSIDNLLASTEQLKGALKTKIESNMEQIKFSKFLATIRTDVPLEFNEDELKVVKADSDKVLELFSELEFRQLATKHLTGPMSSRDAKDAAADPAVRKATAKQQPAATKGGAVSADGKAVQLDLFAMDSGQLTMDSEQSVNRLNESDIQLSIHQFTGSPVHQFSFTAYPLDGDPFSTDIESVTIFCSPSEVYSVSLKGEHREENIEQLKALFENEETEKIGHNLKHDILMLRQIGIEIKGAMFDVMLAHYVLQPELTHSIDYLSDVYLHREASREEVCMLLKEPLLKALREEAQEHLFNDIEMPLVKVLADMEANGVRIDSNALKASSESMTATMNALEQEIQKLAGFEFNVNSPKQVGEALFDRLHIAEKAKKTKGGQYVTSEEVLEGYRGKHPVIGKILEYRGVKKLLSTYIDALPKLVNPKTGRIHTSFNQAVTATGRLSSSNPNLQNIPVRDEQGREIRKVFIPDDGCIFLSADYSQIELRLMAHLSGDENMIEAFQSGKDIHAATAAKIYKVPIEDVTSEMRRRAKTANFGIIYGISAFGLAQRLDISRTEAKELIDGYFATYPHIRDYIQESIDRAKQNGYVETIFHRKRYLADINSSNSIVRGFAERNAVNAPIQGSAADLMKIAMIRVYEECRKAGLKSKMILQVHDELNFSVLPEELETLKKIVVDCMQNVTQLRVPLIADCGTGANWVEAH